MLTKTHQTMKTELLAIVFQWVYFYKWIQIDFQFLQDSWNA